VKEGVVVEKPELEVGRWYNIYCDDFKYLFFVEKIENQDVFGYGFDEENYYYGKGCKLFILGEINKSELATPTEVIERLKAEAVKRGFVEGVKFDNSNLPNDGGLGNILKSFLEVREDVIWIWSTEHTANRRRIYNNGIWATIINEPKPAYIQVPISEIDNLSSKKLGRFVKELASKY